MGIYYLCPSHRLVRCGCASTHEVCNADVEESDGRVFDLERVEVSTHAQVLPSGPLPLGFDS
jgi:hypothetical protein